MVNQSVCVILCFIETLLYSGIIFGWASLVFVFRQLGYFSYLCNGDEDEEDWHHHHHVTMVTAAMGDNATKIMDYIAQDEHDTSTLVFSGM